MIINMDNYLYEAFYLAIIQVQASFVVVEITQNIQWDQSKKIFQRFVLLF